MPTALVHHFPVQWQMPLSDALVGADGGVPGLKQRFQPVNIRAGGSDDTDEGHNDDSAGQRRSSSQYLMYRALRYSLDLYLQQEDDKINIEECIALDYHARRYLNEPGYARRISHSASILTRRYLVKAFRNYVGLIKESNWDPMDAVLFASVSEMLIAQPIVDLVHQHPSLFPDAALITVDQLRGAFYAHDEDVDMETHDIVRALTFVHEGRSFSSLQAFVAELPECETSDEDGCEEDESEEDESGDD